MATSVPMDAAGLIGLSLLQRALQQTLVVNYVAADNEFQVDYEWVAPMGSHLEMVQAAVRDYGWVLRSNGDSGTWCYVNQVFDIRYEEES